MHWINIHTETLRGEEFLGAEPIERATWLSLLGWCCAQENRGIIKGGGDWSSRKWQQICGVTLEEVTTDSQLYEIKDKDLFVHFYPLEHQEKAEASRMNGKKGGRPKKTKDEQTLTEKGDKPIGSILVNLDETQSEPGRNLNSNSNCKSNSNSNSKKVSVGAEKPKFIPPTIQEFIAYLKTALPKINPDWQPEQIQRAATCQFDTYQEQGWKDGNGKPIKIWKTKAKNAMSYKKPWNFGASAKSDGISSTIPQIDVLNDSAPNGWQNQYKALYERTAPLHWHVVAASKQIEIKQSLEN